VQNECQNLLNEYEQKCCIKIGESLAAMKVSKSKQYEIYLKAKTSLNKSTSSFVPSLEVLKFWV